ncbi:MAG: hypothetical protein HY788_01220 [Deltaproteobacteria bacterium]|nr:hypothetical protein [Deltaproteobacteria bacterium]
MIAKTGKGEQVYQVKRIYMPQCTDSLGSVMVLGPDKKLGIIRDTTFQPFQLKRESFEIRLDEPTETIDIEIKLVYQLRPGDELPIHFWKRRISVEQLFPSH